MMYFTLLDLLRFFSSLGVVFHHTFSFYYGRLGVYLFFIISGFVIYFSLQKGLKEYVWGRFLRLYPIFWVCATITYLVTVAYKVHIDFRYYLQGLLMLNSGRMETMIDGVYWTLTFELLFYLYIGVFVLLFSKKYLQWFFIGWLLISFFGFYLRLDQIFFVKLLSIRFAPYFVFGGMLALLIDRYAVLSVKEKFLYIGTLIASSLLPIYISARIAAQKDFITNFTGSFAPDELRVVLSFFILFPLAVYLSYFDFAKKPLFARVCCILGGITYPLYLLHWKIGKTIISSYEPYGHITLLSVGYVVGIVVLAYVLSEIDVRFRRKYKNLIK